MIINCNCLDLLKTMPDNSIDAIVTDPPYGLGKEPDALAMLQDWLTTGHHDVKGRGFMGKEWDAFVPQPAIWRECLRVLKPGGYLLAFAGTRTQDLMALGLRIAGFEIRDVIAWVYGSGFPKSLDVSKALGGQWQGWGTALKPAMEPITVARKPLNGTVAANITKHGTGAINIDGCRVATDDGSNRARPPRTPNEILGGGKGTNLTASEHNDLGRWPANLIHDGAADDLLGHAARFFYCAKASKADRNYGCDGLPDVAAGDMVGREEGSDGMRSPRAGAGRTSGAKNDHPTVKPIALMRYLCRLVTPPGGTVLDPFAGSGTTGVAAVFEGFNFIGAEMDPHSAEIANSRFMFAMMDPNRYIDGSDNKTRGTK